MRKRDHRTLKQLILIWAVSMYGFMPDKVPGFVDDIIVVEAIISVVVFLEDRIVNRR